MKYSNFIRNLENNSDMELVFDFKHSLIRNDYHITEVLNSQISAIDCGKVVSRWNESVVQLFEPATAKEKRYMSVKKALGIFRKSNEAIAIPEDANVVLEFRPKESAAAQRYNVAGVMVKDGKLFVETEGTTTQCKPAKKTGSGCC